MTHRRAFTLIELLVVISIIGLISSVVVASLNSARDKARISSGRQFEAQIGHVAGDMLVGSWNFNSCSGSALDGSGYGNNGTLQMGATYAPDTPDNVGCSVYFDGVDDRVQIPNNIQLSTIYGPSTVSLWFKPATLVGATNRIFSDNCFEWGIYTNGSNIYGAVYNSVSGGAVSENRWYHAALVHEHPNGYSGTVIKLYIDGQLKNQGTWSYGGGENGINDNPYWVGGDGCYGAGNYFNGNVDNVRFYSKPLTASEVGKVYAEESSLVRSFAGGK